MISQHFSRSFPAMDSECQVFSSLAFLVRLLEKLDRFAFQIPSFLVRGGVGNISITQPVQAGKAVWRAIRDESGQRESRIAGLSLTQSIFNSRQDGRVKEPHEGARYR